MPYPTDYSRQFGFEGFQETHPTTPLPGDQVDSELDSIKSAIAGTNAFIKQFSRADGKLANRSVGVDQLAADLVIGFKEPTTWEANVTYLVGDTVFYANKFYTCDTTHTSGSVFDPEKWDEIVDFGAQASAAAASAAAAAASETAAELAETNAETAETNAETAASAAAASAAAAEASATSASVSATAAAGSATSASASAATAVAAIGIAVAVDTIAALRAYSGSALAADQLFYARGHSVKGDGGRGWFLCVTSNPGADDNGAYIHSATSGYYFVRQFDSVPHIQQWGAKASSSEADRTANDAAFVAARNYVLVSGRRLRLPGANGEYIFSGLALSTGTGGTGANNGFILEGDGAPLATKIRIIKDSDNSGIGVEMVGAAYYTLRDMAIFGGRNDQTGAPMAALFPAAAAVGEDGRVTSGICVLDNVNIDTYGYWGVALAGAEQLDLRNTRISAQHEDGAAIFNTCAGVTPPAALLAASSVEVCSPVQSSTAVTVSGRAGTVRAKGEALLLLDQQANDSGAAAISWFDSYAKLDGASTVAVKNLVGGATGVLLGDITFKNVPVEASIGSAADPNQQRLLELSAAQLFQLDIAPRYIVGVTNAGPLIKLTGDVEGSTIYCRGNEDEPTTGNLIEVTGRAQGTVFIVPEKALVSVSQPSGSAYTIIAEDGEEHFGATSYGSVNTPLSLGGLVAMEGNNRRMCVGGAVQTVGSFSTFFVDDPGTGGGRGGISGVCANGTRAGYTYVNQEDMHYRVASVVGKLVLEPNTVLAVTLAKVPDYADDAAAAIGGLAVGDIYRNGSILMIRAA